MGAVRKDGRYFVKRILLYMLILALAAVMLVPFLWMISASLKLNKDVFTYPVKWIPEKLEWSNYSKIWKEIPLLLFFKNSAKLTIIITAIQVFTSSFAAYAFAKLHFKGRDFCFSLVLLQMMVPAQIFISPQYIMVSKMGMLNTIFGLVFPGMVTAFGTFLLRQGYMGLPNDLEEAARLDGCNIGQTFLYIMAPLTRSSMVALGIFTAVFAFKDLMWPMIVNTDKDMLVLSSALAKMQGQYASKFPELMAASLIACIPMIVLYVIFQKQFIEGIATSGGKL